MEPAAWSDYEILQKLHNKIDQLHTENTTLAAALVAKDAAGLAAKNACMVASSGCSHIKTHAECNEARQFAAATKVNIETALSALHEAIALQPHAALAAKLKTDAVRDAAAMLGGEGEQELLRKIVPMFERGEV